MAMRELWPVVSQADRKAETVSTLRIAGSVPEMKRVVDYRNGQSNALPEL